MKANQRSTAAMPSSTFTHTTTCTVPRSSPLLSSSFTPFYPRSQQQLYHPHSGYVGTHDGSFQVPVQQSDDIDVSQNHFSSWSDVRGPKFYDQQYYTSLGAEPYEVSWVPNSGNVWDGGAWQQWGDAVEYAYAEDDTEDSANLFSDSLSYYAGSPALEQDVSACAASNTTCGPVLFPDKNTQFWKSHVNESSEVGYKTSSSITGSTAMHNVFHSVIMPEQVSSATKKLKESSLLSFGESDARAVLGYGQGPAKGERKDVANLFTGRKLDAESSPGQSSVQMSSGFASQAGECESTTYLAENVRAQKEGDVLAKASYNSSKEHVSADSIEAKHSIPAATSDTIESIDNPDLKPSIFSLPNDVIQKEVRSRKSVSQETSMQSSSELCQSFTLPKDVSSHALEQMNGFEGSHQEKTNSGLIRPEDVGASSNEPHLLVECIHNLAKVLLSSQSKTSMNAPSSSDCLVLENTICMLSHRLFHCSASEAAFCQDPNSQQELKNTSDSLKGFVVTGGLQKDSNQSASMKHTSLKRDFQYEVLQNANKLTASSHVGVDNQNSSYKKLMEVSEEELRMLRGEVQRLQEEVAYERVESNATVSLYKKLWSEAEEALKVSRAQIREIRTELAGLKQEMTNLKHSGWTHELTNVESITSLKQEGLQQENPNIVTSSSQGIAASDLSRALTEVMYNARGGTLKNDSEILTGYLNPGIPSNCQSTGTPLAKFEKADSKHSKDLKSSDYSSKRPELSTSKSYSKHTIMPPTNLEGDVAQRLSLILSRQGLDLNKSCTESSVEWPSGSSTILEPSSTEAVPFNKNYLVWSEASYLVNDNQGCQRRHDPEVEDSLYGFKEGELNDRGVDVTELEEGICQEEEIEIICFKPGIGDSNFSCLRGEPEWEDVVVNVLDDQRSTGKETV